MHSDNVNILCCVPLICVLLSVSLYPKLLGNSLTDLDTAFQVSTASRITQTLSSALATLRTLHVRALRFLLTVDTSEAVAYCVGEI